MNIPIAKDDETGTKGPKKRSGISGPFRRAPVAELALILVIGLFSSLAARACSVPVFRFALERWPASPYEAWVVHREALSADQEKWLKECQSGNNTDSAQANLRWRRLDLSADPPREEAGAEVGPLPQPLPALVLRYPRDASAEGVVWSGPLTHDSIRRLLNSPMRQRMAQRLLKGDSGVWVLLESGDRSRNDRVATLLQARLTHLEKTLEISRLAPEDVANRVVSVAEADLKVTFSLMRLSRDDPEEEILVRMLLGSEDDLRESREPIVFPVFGRGRALYALVGDGINDENIDEAGAFLVGPCSCVVKAENPGIDLLVSANWDSVVASVPAPATALPELTGLVEFTASTNSMITEPDVTPEEGTYTPMAPVASVTFPIGLSLTVLLALGGLAIAGGVFLLFRKKE